MAGKHIRNFIRNGVRSYHLPKAAILIVAGTLMSTTAALHIPTAAHSTPSLAPASAPAKLSASDLLRDQKALLRLIQTEADRSSLIEYNEVTGKKIDYVIQDLDRAIINHVTMVQERLDTTTDKSVDALYGIDDGMWAWMMRRHAASAGLASAMEGITVNDDGSIDAVNAFKLNAMLELKNDPVAATKVFARWLASEIMEFDGQMGRSPSLGEIAVIGLTDAQGGMDGANMAKDFPETKLGPAILIEHNSWKRGLFVDKNGWMTAKDAMTVIENHATKTFMHLSLIHI